MMANPYANRPLPAPPPQSGIGGSAANRINQKRRPSEDHETPQPAYRRERRPSLPAQNIMAQRAMANLGSSNQQRPLPEIPKGELASARKPGNRSAHKPRKGSVDSGIGNSQSQPQTKYHRKGSLDPTMMVSDGVRKLVRNERTSIDYDIPNERAPPIPHRELGANKDQPNSPRRKGSDSSLSNQGKGSSKPKMQKHSSRNEDFPSEPPPSLPQSPRGKVCKTELAKGRQQRSGSVPAISYNPSSQSSAKHNSLPEDEIPVDPAPPIPTSPRVHAKQPSSTKPRRQRSDSTPAILTSSGRETPLKHNSFPEAETEIPSGILRPSGGSTRLIDKFNRETMLPNNDKSLIVRPFPSTTKTSMGVEPALTRPVIPERFNVQRPSSMGDPSAYDRDFESQFTFTVIQALPRPNPHRPEVKTYPSKQTSRATAYGDMYSIQPTLNEV